MLAMKVAVGAGIPAVFTGLFWLTVKCSWTLTPTRHWSLSGWRLSRAAVVSFMFYRLHTIATFWITDFCDLLNPVGLLPSLLWSQTYMAVLVCKLQNMVSLCALVTTSSRTIWELLDVTEIRIRSTASKEFNEQCLQEWSEDQDLKIADDKVIAFCWLTKCKTIVLDLELCLLCRYTNRKSRQSFDCCQLKLSEEPS